MNVDEVGDPDRAAFKWLSFTACRICVKTLFICEDGRLSVFILDDIGIDA